MNLRNLFLNLGHGVPKEDYTALLIENQNLTKDKIILADENMRLNNDITDPNEEYWNNKRPKVEHFKWLVHETDGDYQVDVRNWLMPYDATLQEIKGKTNDEKTYNALMWVMDNIKYNDDEKVYGFPEYWAKVYQTTKHKRSDCEDGNAILLNSMLLKAGVPYWRIRSNIGMVNGGYHAYLTYCRETDNQFIVLDFCYWPNRKLIKDRPLHKDEQNYSDEKRNFMVDGSWNLKYCFGEMLTMSQSNKSHSLIKPLKAKKSIGGKNGSKN